MIIQGQDFSSLFLWAGIACGIVMPGIGLGTVPYQRDKVLSITSQTDACMQLLLNVLFPLFSMTAVFLFDVGC